MTDAITIEIWYEEKKSLWMTKTLHYTSPRNSRTMTVLDFYDGNVCPETLSLKKRQIKIIRRANIVDQRNATLDTVEKLRMFEPSGIIGCNEAIPVKIFCPYGSHVIFLNDVRQNYIKCTGGGEFPSSSVDEKHKLPKKLVRSGTKPWKPVSVFYFLQYDHLNWTSIIEKSELSLQQKRTREKLERTKKPTVSNENKENAKRKYWDRKGSLEKVKPPVFPRQDSKVVRNDMKDNNGNTINNEKNKSLVLTKQEVNIDLNDNIVNAKPNSPKQQNKTFKHNGAEHPMAAFFTQQISNEKNNTSPPQKPRLSGTEYKIEKDNIVLHFNSPVIPKKHAEVEKENKNVLNSSLSEEGSTLLPLSSPITEKDTVDCPPSPAIQGRKIANIFDKGDSKDSRKVRTLDRNDSKEQRKKAWFGKSDHKLKNNADSENSCTTLPEPKSKFKKQHRKSRSVMVQPTYLSSNQEQNTIPKDVSKIPKRKNSMGGSQKETKPEKLSLFKRIYSSPQSEKKLDINDLSLTKRTRRHTQPVGCIQKEFIRELKGKLDKYTPENGEESNEKVVWNINI